MAQLRKEPQAVVRNGLAATYHSDFTVGGSNTYLIRNPGNVILHFKKSGAGNCDVTIITPNAVDGLAVADRTVQIPASTGDRFIGPFPPSIYNNVNGDIEISLSEVTGLTGAILQIT